MCSAVPQSSFAFVFLSLTAAAVYFTDSFIVVSALQARRLWTLLALREVEAERERERERQRETETETETDRQTDRGRVTDRQIDRQASKQTN